MALTGKQRRYLRGLAHHLKPVVLTGASGVTEQVLTKVATELENHELIKVKVNDGPDIAREVASDVAARLSQRRPSLREAAVPNRGKLGRTQSMASTVMGPAARLAARLAARFTSHSEATPEAVANGPTYHSYLDCLFARAAWRERRSDPGRHEEGGERAIDYI